MDVVFNPYVDMFFSKRVPTKSMQRSSQGYISERIRVIPEVKSVVLE